MARNKTSRLYISLNLRESRIMKICRNENWGIKRVRETLVEAVSYFPRNSPVLYVEIWHNERSDVQFYWPELDPMTTFKW